MRFLWSLSLVLLALSGCMQSEPAGQEPPLDEPAAGDNGDEPPAQPDAPKEVYTSGHPMEGQPVPSYSATSLNGYPGDLQAYEGGVVLVTTWASWCSICKGDEPTWDHFVTDYADLGLTVFAVSREANQASAQSYVEDAGYEYPAFWDDGVNDALGMRDYQPNHMLIDREGTIVSVYEGSLRARPGGEDGLRADIETLLG